MSALKTEFGKGGSVYAQFRPAYPKSLFETVLKRVKPPYQTALDLGAGTGISSAILSKIFHSVTAVEADEKMLRAGSFADNVCVINALAEEVHFAENTFDLITAGNAFYWMDAERILPKMYKWLKAGGIIAAYRYNMPLTDNADVNAILNAESNSRWDAFRHERLKDTDYTYRNISNSPRFCNVQLKQIENIEKLTVEELVGFFASTSYGGAYLRSIENPNDYLMRLTEAVKKANSSNVLSVDFSLELVTAEKK